MDRHFEKELGNLRESILRMGSLVERMVANASQCVFELDTGLARLVIADEEEINTMQVRIDQDVVRTLALHQLMAADLRFALAVSRINAELERIGDQAVNIAEAASRLAQYPRTDPPNVDLPRMSELAREMVSNSLNAFVESDEELAKKVLQRDDEVDDLRDQAFRSLLTYMMSNSSRVFAAFDLILVAKDLERVADLATNIAEDVIYVVAGRDVRHHAAK